MEEDEIKPEELKLSDKLAVERTVLAADRTMLAGVRTSLSFIGFGFTIFNVLRYVLAHTPTKLLRPETPRNVGLFMIVAGTAPLFLMMIQYYRTLKRMGRKESVYKNPNFQMACIISLLGTIHSHSDSRLHSVVSLSAGDAVAHGFGEALRWM